MTNQKTIIEQIESATAAYLVPLNKDHTRHQVYLMIDGELEVLWPSDCHLTESRDLLPDMVYTKRKTLPAYHWPHREHPIACALNRINPRLKVLAISGHSPWIVRTGEN